MLRGTLRYPPQQPVAHTHQMEVQREQKPHHGLIPVVLVGIVQEISHHFVVAVQGLLQLVQGLEGRPGSSHREATSGGEISVVNEYCFRAQENEMVGRRKLSGIVASGAVPQNQEAGVAKPVHEQHEGYDNYDSVDHLDTPRDPRKPGILRPRSTIEDLVLSRVSSSAREYNM